MAAGDPQNHTAKLTEELVPGLGTDSSGSQGGGKDVAQAGMAMRGQLDGALQGVDEPPQHNFAGGPAGIALVEFGQGDGFTPDGGIISRIIWAEDTVGEVKELAPEGVQGRWVSLGHQDFVIDEYIRVAEGAATPAPAGPGPGGRRDRSGNGKPRRRGSGSGECGGGVRPRVGGGALQTRFTLNMP